MKTLKFVRESQSAGKKSLVRPRSHSQQKSPSISPIKPTSLKQVLNSHMLTELVLKEAALSAQNEKEMTLMHILNTLDQLIETLVPKPTPDIAQKTYHELVQRENRRTKDSIAHIQSQIEDLQAGHDSNSTSPEKSLDSNRFKTASFTQFKQEPEIIVVQATRNIKRGKYGSSTAAMSISNPSTNRVNSVDSRSNKIQPFLFKSELYSGQNTPQTNEPTVVTFSPSITDIHDTQLHFSKGHSIDAPFTRQRVFLTGSQLVEEVQQLQKNESFILRCQKLVQMYQIAQQKSINKDLQCVSPATKLPKFKIIASPLNSSSSSEDIFFNSARAQKVIDGNKLLAVAFRVRKLLSTLVRSLSAAVFERKARTYVLNICRRTFQTSLLKRAFFSLYSHSEKHRGHQQNNFICQRYLAFKQKRKFMDQWRKCLCKVQTERHQFNTINSSRLCLQSKNCFQAWHQVIVHKKLQLMQTDAAIYLSKKQKQIKAFHILKSFTQHQIHSRLSQFKSQTHYTLKLMRVALDQLLEHSIQMSIIKAKSKLLAHQHSDHLLRRAFKSLHYNKIEVQHFAQLGKIASISHSKLVQRKALRSLAKYQADQRQQRYQLSQVRCLYEQRLKMKLLRAVHETNLEFIRFQVHTEHYFENKLKRVFVKCLARRVAQKHAFQAVKVWIQTLFRLWFLSKNTKLSHKIKSTLFQRIKSETLQLKQFRQKRQRKQQNRILRRWHKYTLKHQKLNRRLLDLNTRHRLGILNDCFTAFKLVISQKQKEQRTCNKIRKNSLKQVQFRFFRVWLSAQTQNQLKKDRKQLAQVLGTKLHLKHAYLIWRHNFMQMQRQKHLFQLSKQVQVVRKERFFKKWLNSYQSLQMHTKLVHVVGEHISHQVKQKVWLALKANLLAAQTHNNLIAQCQTKRQHSLKAICLQAWRYVYVPAQRVKKHLFEVVVQDRLSLVLKQCFAAFKQYFSMRRLSKMYDRQQILSIQAKQQFKYMLKWHKKTTMRQASRHLSNLHLRLQFTNSFRQLGNHGLIHSAIVSHCADKHQVNLTNTVMQAFKRYKSRYEIKAAQVQLMGNISKILLGKQYLRLWRQLLSQRWQREQRFDQLVVVYARWLKHQCFVQLKQLASNRHRIQNRIQSQAFDLKKACFNSLRKYYLGEVALRYYQQHRALQTRLTILQKWRREVDSSRVVAWFRSQRDNKIQQKCIKMLKSHVEHSQYYSSLQQTLTSIFSNKMLKTAFQSLQDYYQLKRQQNTKIFQVQSLIHKHRKRGTFAQLIANAVSQSAINRRTALIYSKMQLRVFIKVVNVWKAQCEQRILNYKRVQRFRQLKSRKHLRIFVAQWRRVNSDSKAHQLKCQQMLALKLSYIFGALFNYSQTKRLSKQRLQSVDQYHRRRSLLVTFRQLKQKVEHQQISKHLNQRAMMFKLIGLQSKSLYMLRLNRTCRQNRRVIIARVTEQRLIPKAFKQLQIYFQLRKVSQQMKFNAKVHRETLLKAVCWQQFNKVVQRGREQSALMAQIDQVYYRKLLSVVVRMWNIAASKHKQIKQKRALLYRACKSVSDQECQKYWFALLRIAVLQSQQRWLSASLNRDRTAVRQIFLSLKKHVYGRQLNKKIGDQIQANRVEQVKAMFLRRWVKGLQQASVIQGLKQKQDRVMQQKVIAGLKFKVQIKLLHEYAQLHSDARVQRKAFSSLVHFLTDMASRRHLAHQYELQMYEQSVTRCLLALKFNVVTEKGLRCLQQKQSLQKKYFAWNALRYHSVLQKVGRGYHEFRVKKVKSEMFGVWFGKAVKINRAKKLLHPVLKRKNDNRRWFAFREWKRSAYLGRVCALLKYYGRDQGMKLKMKQLILAWRKYTYLKRNSVSYIVYFQKKRNQELKHSYLSIWYETLMQNLPARLLCEKLDRTHKLLTLRTAMTKIATVAILRSQMIMRAKEVQVSKSLGLTKQCFSDWRKAFKLNQGLEVFENRRKRKLFQRTILVWYNQMVHQAKQKKKEDQDTVQANVASEYYKERVLQRCLLAWRRYTHGKRIKRSATELYRAQSLKKVLQVWRNPPEVQKSNEEKLQIAKMQRILCAWASYSQYKHQSRRINNQLSQEACLMRKNTLARKAFKAWQSTVTPKPQNYDIISSLQASSLYHDSQLETIPNDRHRLYSLFSSWKLYVKERVLLKRYLVECGESPENVSMMSTSQLNLNSGGYVSFRGQN